MTKPNRRRSTARNQYDYNPLEPRQLLAGLSLAQAASFISTIDAPISGVTVVTHGYTTEHGGSYLEPIADAIGEKYGGYKIVYETSGPGDEGGFYITNHGDSESKELILVHDWSTESHLPGAFEAYTQRTVASGWTEAAGDGLFNILVGLGLAAPNQQLHDYHFIAHSFGSAVTSEAIERFAVHEIDVDHVTFLDPHDFNEDFIPVDSEQQQWTVGEPDGYGVTKWSNVNYAETYYQTRSNYYPDPFYVQAVRQNPMELGGLIPFGTTELGFNALLNAAVPSGRPIAGTYNVFFNSTDMPLLDRFANGFQKHDHAYVWTAYEDSIRVPNVPDFEHDAFGKFGYQLSRLGGGTESRQLLPGGTAGSFLSELQDHQYSESLNGFSDEELSNGSWVPNMSEGGIFNGDFEHQSHESRGSISIAPGWSQHGGEQATVIDGEGVVYNSGLLGKPLVHNYFLIDSETHFIEFQLRKDYLFGENFANDNEVKISIKDGITGEIASRNISHAELDTSFSTFVLFIPSEFRGKVVTLEFELLGTKPNYWESIPQLRVDNVTQAPYQVLGSGEEGSPQKAELSTQSFSTSTTQANANGSVDIDFQLLNSGGTTAAPFDIQFFLRPEASGADYLLGSPVNVGALSSGVTARIDDSIVIGAGIANGVYRLGVTVDINGDVDELDESNNVFLTDSTISIGQDAQLDLAIFGLESPARLLPNSNFQVAPTITNEGGGDFDSVDIEFVLWSQNATHVLGTQSTTQLGSQSFSLSIPNSVAPGSYTLQAFLDPANDLTESTRLNNVAEAVLLITDPNTVGANGFVFPAGDRLTGTGTVNGFDEDGHAIGHLGYDFRGYWGQGYPIVSVGGGVVTYAQDTGQPGWGKMVIVRHDPIDWGGDKTIYSVYGHVEPEVGVNDRVELGERIATVGTKAAGSTAAHLHLEIRSGNEVAGLLPGPGYHTNTLYQNFDSNGNPDGFRMGGRSYEQDIVWYDPLDFISNNLYDPDNQKADLVPWFVNAPFVGNRGQTIQVPTGIENTGAKNVGSYTVEYYLSVNQHVGTVDIPLAVKTRINGIAGRGKEQFVADITLPSDLEVDKNYWIGIRIDPDNAVEEYEEFNNFGVDQNPILIISGVTDGPDLTGDNLELYPVLADYEWGEDISLRYKVKNIGTQNSSATQMRFVLVNHPRNPTFEYVLGTKSMASRSPGRTASGVAHFQMPSAAPTGFVGGQLYVRMETDYQDTNNEINESNNSGVANGLDWLRLPGNYDAGPSGPTTGSAVDLKGVSFSVHHQNVYFWGDDFYSEFTFENDGDRAAENFGYSIVLSKDRNFSQSDFLIANRRVYGLAPGESKTDRTKIYLPGNVPSQLRSGNLYLGVILDPENDTNDALRGNNEGLGDGIDYVSLKVVPRANFPEPEIGSFEVNPNTQVVRGEHVDLYASDLLDDNDQVNGVQFRLDTNNNGQWDDTDLYLGEGSQTGLSSGKTLRTNSDWANGFNTVMARAYDNHNLWSDVKFATVEIIGNPTGPFSDDSYENNDTADTATYLGADDSYRIENLAYANQDHDYFTFDVYGNEPAQIVVTIEFFQEEHAGAGNPHGDLYLAVGDFRGDGSLNQLGVSYTGSSTGQTQEQIVLTNYANDERYWVQVFGISYEENPNYTLDIQLVQPSDAPVAGDFIVSRTTVVQGQPIDLSLEVAEVNGAIIEGVPFFVDFNQNGRLSYSDNELIGVDWGAVGQGEGPGGIHQITADTSSWPIGSNRLVSFIQADGIKKDSLGVVQIVEVIPNNVPTIGSLDFPVDVIDGAAITLTASDVFDGDPESYISNIQFHLDTNGNGLLDDNDFLVGEGIADGSNWSLESYASDWGLGIQTIFVVATDDVGGESLVSTETIEVLDAIDHRPSIGGFVVPDLVYKGDLISLLAENVTDPNGDANDIKFYIDSNENAVWDSEDVLAANGFQNGVNWTADIESNQFVRGPVRLFAVATDFTSPSIHEVVAANLLIVDLVGPKVIGVSPDDPVVGSISSIVIHFDEPVEPSSVSLADVLEILDPNGTPIVPTAIVPVAGTSDRSFSIEFPRQTSTGDYSVTLGSDILDLAENPLDQDEDGIGGELGDDFYVGQFGVVPPAAEFEFLNSFGGMSQDRLYDLATDGNGNLITFGHFRQTSNFNPDPNGTPVELTGVGFTNDVFIAKYNEEGEILWARRFGGDGNDYAEKVDMDDAGNIYIIGRSNGDVSFDGHLFSAGDQSLGFVAKLDSEGNAQWVRQFNSIGTGHGYFYDMEVDSSGNVFATGQVLESAVVDGVTVTSADGSIAVVGKWDTDGNRQWVVSFGGAGGERPEAISVDSSRVFLGGTFSTEIDFGSTSITDGSGFLAELDPANGAAIWAKAVGGSVYDLAVSGSQVVLGGPFASSLGPVNFNPDGSNVHTADGSSDMFMSSFSLDGDYSWTSIMSGPGDATPYSIASAGDGSVAFSGWFSSTVDMDPDPMNEQILTQSTGSYLDSFVGKLNADGSLAWVRQTESDDGGAFGHAVAVDQSNNVWFGGEYSGTITTDSRGQSQYSAASIEGTTDSFFAKLSEPIPNSAPVIDHIADQTIDEHSTLNLTITAMDENQDQNLTFSILSGPNGATIDPQSGLITWTTDELDGPAQFMFVVAVTDDHANSKSDSTSFIVTVNESNEVPLINSIPDQNVFEFSELTVQVVGVDPDVPVQNLTYELAGTIPSGATIDPETGLVTWTPGESHGGSTVSIKVRVTDDGEGEYSSARSFNVTVHEADNLAPEITVGAGTVVEGGTIVLTPSDLMATDADSTDSDLEFVIQLLPEHGQLFLNGSLLEAFDRFTQQDVLDGLVEYVHNCSETTIDLFEIIAVDPAGNESGVASFNIEITPSTNEEVLVSFSGSDLLIQDIGPASDERLNFTISGGMLRIQDLENEMSAGANISQIDCHTVELPLASILGGVRIETGEGNDEVYIDADLNLDGALVVSDGDGDDLVSIGGNLQVAANHAIEITADAIEVPGNLSTFDAGEINLIAHRTLVVRGMITSESGSILLNSNSSGFATVSSGVSLVDAQITTTGDGSIELVGVNGGGGSQNSGVRLQNSIISASGLGGVQITGSSLLEGATANTGVYSTGTFIYSQSGVIWIQGIAGDADSRSSGQFLDGTTVETASGSISLVGSAGLSENSDDFGLRLVQSNFVSLGAEAANFISFEGASGGQGISFTLSNVTSIGGDLSFVGDGDVTGVQISSSSFGGADTSGRISIAANKIDGRDYWSSATFESSGVLQVMPLNPSSDIGLGYRFGDLMLDSDNFDNDFVDGFSEIIAGDLSDTGEVRIRLTGDVKDDFTVYGGDISVFRIDANDRDDNGDGVGYRNVTFVANSGAITDRNNSPLIEADSVTLDGVVRPTRFESTGEVRFANQSTLEVDLTSLSEFDNVTELGLI